ncbi:MAG: AAA family ATPase [Gammaproteobacteria bacterium]|nr:AAA family ATPase [Gammaproteobacteria bacterium]
MSTTKTRTEVSNLLDQIAESKRPELLTLFGRRRVGKTFTIRNRFEDKKDIIFFDVTGSKDAPMSEQISNFTNRLGEIFYNGVQLVQAKNWNGTFKLLTEAITKSAANKKIVLFFDEFPWMATKNSRLLQNLDYYWNQYWSKDKRIKLIICGSSASWIINNIINNKGGLHNRMTRQIHLEPFNLAQTKTFLRNLGVRLNNQQLLQLYMVTGGIPYYLVNIERGKSAAQIIDQLAFKTNSILLNEFNILFASLFDHHEICIEIIRLIAQHRYGISKEEIFGKTSIDKGKKGIKILQSLEDTGFIMSFKPHFHTKKGIYYRVIDEYTMFYLNWIEPIKNTLLTHSFEDGYWQIQQKLPGWQSWSGYAFEAVCYKHIRQIRKALKLSPAAIPNSWRYVPKQYNKERGAQIDLLFDRQDNSITLCEIKYNDKPFVLTKDYVDILKHKMTTFKQQTRTKKQLFMAFIAANDIKNNYYSDDIIDGVVTLDSLFEE